MKLDKEIKKDLKNPKYWFSGYINGDLLTYDINSLINAVKERNESLHTNLTYKDSIYHITISGFSYANVITDENLYISIVRIDYDDNQERILDEDFNSWNECRSIYKDFVNDVTR